jgi:hypothetical protein
VIPRTERRMIRGADHPAERDPAARTSFRDPRTTVRAAWIIRDRRRIIHPARIAFRPIPAVIWTMRHARRAGPWRGG